MGTSTASGGRPRIGVLGGSFNPPHIGHLVIASQAHHQVDLDCVYFVPAWCPPHKLIDDRVPAATRLRLTEAAVGADPRFAVSSIEIERRLRYSVDTLTALSETAGGADLWLVIGSDSLLTLSTWKDPERLLGQARLAVAPRPGDDPESVAAAAASYGAVVLGSPALSLSSTDIRRRVRSGEPIRYLVPAAVERLVMSEGLYRAAPDA